MKEILVGETLLFPSIVARLKKYSNKFVDGMIREKVPIHVQAFKEVSVLDNNVSIDKTANDISFKKANPFGSSILK